MEVTKQTIKNFEKLLIELGGFHELHEDGSIWRVSDGEQIAVPMGKHNLPLILFEEGMASGADVVYLNPFSEGLGASRDREWFYDMLQKVLGGVIKSIVKQTATMIVKKENNQNYDTYELINKVGPFCDDQFIKDIDKIQLADWFTIFYNKSRKIAEAQCAIFTDEFKAAHPKYRKKTWDGLEAFYMEIFRTTHLEEIYHYQSSLISIPETDAKLQIACAVIKDIDQFSKDILGIDLKSNELMDHLPNIEGYGKLYSWAILRRGPVEDDKKDSGKPAPATGLPCIAPFNGAAPTVAPGMVSAAFAAPMQQTAPAMVPMSVPGMAVMPSVTTTTMTPTMAPAMAPMGYAQPGMMMPAYGTSPMMPAAIPGQYNPATGYTPGGTIFGGNGFYR